MFGQQLAMHGLGEAQASQPSVLVKEGFGEL